MIAVRYLGKKEPLNIIGDETLKKPKIERIEGEGITITGASMSDADLNRLLIKFYKKEAKKHIEKRLRHFQPMIKRKYKSFKIESSEVRWGSCNGAGELTFNWKLMLFPEKAIDYVVIHELCHLMHLNHDRSFWRLVGKLCPDYKEIMPIIGTEKTRDL